MLVRAGSSLPKSLVSRGIFLFMPFVKVVLLFFDALKPKVVDPLEFFLRGGCGHLDLLFLLFLLVQLFLEQLRIGFFLLVFLLWVFTHITSISILRL